jgi:hypothetical protein
MTRKLTLLVIFTLTTLLLNCGSLPRTVVLEASDKPQEYKLDACAVSIVVPSGWRFESEASVPPVFHAVKGKIDIVIDVLTDKEVDQVKDKMIAKIKQTVGKPIVGGRVAKRTNPNKIEITTIYTMSEDKKDSADIDVIACPSGAGSLVLYTYSPIATYAKDRAEVEAIANSVKSLIELPPAKVPAKKK